MTLVDGDLDKAGTANDGDGFAEGDLGVVEGEAVDFFSADGEFEGAGFNAVELGFGEVGDEVAETVNFEDLAGPEALGGAGGPETLELEVVLDAGAEFGGGDTEGEVGGDGGEDVAAVEGAADGGAEVLGLLEAADADGFVAFEHGAVDHGEEAVVGSDEVVAAGFDEDGAAGGSDAGIDDGDMDRFLGEGGPGLHEGEGAFGDFEGGDAVGDVDDGGLRAEAEDDTFHCGDIVIVEAEIGGECDDWLAHGKLVGAVLRFYFDHNATTPVSEAVISAMVECLRMAPGNASSIHRFGQEAKQRMELARRQVAMAVGAKPDQVIFTGGGTEANNLAIFGSLRPGKRHVITTAVEHPAVLSPAREVEATVVPVDGQGLVDPDEIRRAIRPDTALISVMSVNNELGTIQPVGEVLAIAREHGVPVHTDAVQALGKTAVPAADFVTVSAHKVYGPQGVGALVARMPVSKVTFGGHHERDRRPGTENVAGIVGFGAACADLTAPEASLRDRLEELILERIPRTRVNGRGAPRVGNTTNVLFEGIEGEPLVIGLDLKGFAVSSGAACSSGAVEPSHVLTAIGLSREDARSCLRFSLGRGNTEEQVVALVEALEPVVARLRKLSPAYA